MATRVTWLGRAVEKTRRDLVPAFTRDLRELFPEARAITVYDCFGGYSQDHERKIVLGVEVKSKNAFRTHAVKLGTADAVACDYEGWRKCVLKYNFASRIFVSLSKATLQDDRVAIIYEDACRFFGSADEDQGPKTLETVVNWSIMTGKPTPQSVERVIRQIYTDMDRWFYRTASPSKVATARFYKARLRRAMDRWKRDEWRRDLRRDVIWLFCGHTGDEPLKNMNYADPVDYVAWALRESQLPETLVGRSHGDLHGRNIYVGVQRNEAEYPAVFDYGEMDSDNVLVWDFVKLETELKVRFLTWLFDNKTTREALMGIKGLPHLGGHKTLTDGLPSAITDPRLLRASQLEFAFRFENILRDMTRRIHSLSDPEVTDPPGGRHITGDERLDRAFGIILRIRQEAALFMGDYHPLRKKRADWADEYYFGLAAYGLCTAKFDYKESESAFALVSAGVAISETRHARERIAGAMAKGVPPCECETRRRKHCFPSYLAPIAQAHELWLRRRRKRDVEKALSILACGVRQFPHAPPLLQEYALLQAESGQPRAALRTLAPIEDLCQIFHDDAVLSRLGRTCKDLGDRALQRRVVHRDALKDHPALQWYRPAYRYYREAYDVSKSYYPGINAAAMAAMMGHSRLAQELAEAVLDLCDEANLVRVSQEESFWIMATRGEALILLGRPEEAASFYRSALGDLPKEDVGAAQSSYNQIDRLAWAMDSALLTVRDVFGKSKFKLAPGPFTG